jgi:hypothetical protein
VCGSFWGLKKFKMAAVATVTKVQIATKYKNLGGFLYLAAILYLGYHGNGHHFDFFQPPKAATYYGGYSYKVDHNMACV